MHAPNRDPTPAEASAPLRLPALGEYRAAAARRRAEAFCDAPEYILGQLVRPLTPRTFSMLLATGNRFIVGGQPTERDVRNYLWFHSPLYGHCGAFAWPLRRWLALDRLTTRLTQPFHRLLGLGFSTSRYAAMLTLTIVEISRSVENDFADASRSSGRPGTPLATLEAQLIHEFADAHRWAPEKTRQTPLRQLFQLHRCIRRARGERVIDDGEEEILFNHLARRNAELAQARAASPISVNA